jgi:hypothetical protein
MSKRLQTGGRLTSGWDVFGSELCSKPRNDVTSSSELRLLRSEGGELRTEGALGPEDASDMNQQLQILSNLRSEIPQSRTELTSYLSILKSEEIHPMFYFYSVMSDFAQYEHSGDVGCDVLKF